MVERARGGDNELTRGWLMLNAAGEAHRTGSARAVRAASTSSSRRLVARRRRSARRWPDLTPRGRRGRRGRPARGGTPPARRPRASGGGVRGAPARGRRGRAHEGDPSPPAAMAARPRGPHPRFAASSRFRPAGSPASSGCTPRTCCRAFAARHGCTPGEFQRRLRAERAMQRIVDGGDALSRIAAETGLRGPEPHDRAVAAYYGDPPACLRRRWSAWRRTGGANPFKTPGVRGVTCPGCLRSRRPPLGAAQGGSLIARASVTLWSRSRPGRRALPAAPPPGPARRTPAP